PNLSLTLSSFDASISGLQAGSPPILANIAATLSLASSFGLVDLILVRAMSLAGVEEPSALQLRARQMAFLSVAAPTVFVFMSVLLYFKPVPDEMVWSVIWLLAILYVGFDRFRGKETGTKSAQQTPAIRVVH